MVRTIAQRSSVLDRDSETGPDLTSGWQWTLAVLVCAALAGAFQERKYETEFKSQ